MAKPYTESDARRAVNRHAQRTADERQTLLRSMLCHTATDREPIYSGTDPETGKPYEGPSTVRWTLETLAYFITADALHSGSTVDQSIADLTAAVKNGAYVANHHHNLRFR
jgi:hypothetical protein